VRSLSEYKTVATYFGTSSLVIILSFVAPFVPGLQTMLFVAVLVGGGWWISRRLRNKPVEEHHITVIPETDTEGMAEMQQAYQAVLGAFPGETFFPVQQPYNLAVKLMDRLSGFATPRPLPISIGLLTEATPIPLLVIGVSVPIQPTDVHLGASFAWVLLRDDDGECWIAILMAQRDPALVEPHITLRLAATGETIPIARNPPAQAKPSARSISVPLAPTTPTAPASTLDTAAVPVQPVPMPVPITVVETAPQAHEAQEPPTSELEDDFLASLLATVACDAVGDLRAAPMDAPDEPHEAKEEVVPGADEDDSADTSSPVDEAEAVAAEAEGVEPHPLALRAVECLRSFKLGAQPAAVTVGPTVTRIEIIPDSGVRISAIAARKADLALALSATSVRVIGPMPGKGTVGIEIANKVRTLVRFADVARFVQPTIALPLIIGRTNDGEARIEDLATMPHLLIAGATGAGKSVMLNTIICGLVQSRTPSELRLLLIDPKKVEFTPYHDLPHLWEAVVTNTVGAHAALNRVVAEMMRRYGLLARYRVKNIADYQKRRAANPEMPPLSYLVVIVDEFGDLTHNERATTTRRERDKEEEEEEDRRKESLEAKVCRLAQLARAAGIHLILATQRPSVDVITGTIKANFLARIAFAVTSITDSRIILDVGGAESLLSRGDMLFMSPQRMGLERIQGAYISDEEIETLVGEAQERWGDDHLQQKRLTHAASMPGGGMETSADTSVVVAPRVSQPPVIQSRTSKPAQFSHAALLARWPEALHTAMSETLERRGVVALIIKAQRMGVSLPFMSDDGSPLPQQEWEAALQNPVVQTVVITAVTVLHLSQRETCRLVFGTNTNTRIVERIGEIVRRHER
jgi:hypothetical protein